MKPREWILVPLDGSARAERILPVVKNLFQHEPATTLLLRVLPKEATAGEEEMAIRYLRDIVRDAACLDARNGLDRHLEYQVVRGSPALEIQRITTHCQVSLIALSTHGRSGLSRWLLGSVAETIVRTASVPVLLLNDRILAAQPFKGVNGRTRDSRPGPVLVPLDGSPLAEAVLPVATRMAGALRARLHLVEVLSPVPQGAAVVAGEWGIGEEVVGATRDETIAALATIRERLEAEGHAVTMDVSIGFPQERLLAAIEQEHAALVAMATHGRSGFKRAILGSVADHVVRHAPCPVLLVGPAAIVD